MEVRAGDTVRLKKRHPCGSYEWEVTRVGADVGLKCRTCHRHVVLTRAVFERRVTALLRGGTEAAC